jgi:two-component system, sensor histidine kinase and response regulator
MTEASPESVKSETPRRKVLVVDDDAILNAVMSEQLSSLGWSVTLAENGEAAIAQISQASPDLAVVDISMPKLDGFGLLRYIRQNPRSLDLPIIVCTSHNNREPIEQAYRLGASSFVTKPINWPQFLHHAQFVMRNGDTERALRAARAEALAASRTKSAMFQVLSHELKTPLTALIGMTAVIDKTLRGRTNPGISNEFEHVIEAATRLNAIVSDIMLLSKAVAGNQRKQFSPVTLSEILDDGLIGLKSKAAEKKVTLLIPPQNQEVRLSCDLRLIHQAVSKLVDNAIRFSPAGSTVELWGHVSPKGSIIISVKDEGPGLSQQKLKECLQPFMQEDMSYSRPANGLGLGLPIAKAICEAHGGELAIQTAPGQGMLAAIVLPPSLLIRTPEQHHG